jgi:hypothetical protein
MQAAYQNIGQNNAAYYGNQPQQIIYTNPNYPQNPQNPQNQPPANYGNNQQGPVYYQN